MQPADNAYPLSDNIPCWLAVFTKCPCMIAAKVTLGTFVPLCLNMKRGQAVS